MTTSTSIYVSSLLLFFIVAIAFAVGIASAQYYNYNPQDGVLLEHVQALTFRKGQMTNYRRTSPVPQLKLVGGAASRDGYEPDVVQCVNQGHDGTDFQWKCEADMDSKYRFGTVQVNCEGLASSTDRYVLRGSCGLEYTLEYTEEGRQSMRTSSQQGTANIRRNNAYGTQHRSTPIYQDYSRTEGSLLRSVLTILFLVGSVFVLLQICKKRAAPRTGSGGTSGFGSSSSSGYGNIYPDARPPPYNPEYDHSSGSSSSAYGYGSYPGSGFRSTSSSAGTNNNSSSSSWWGPALGGAALGYLFGSSRGRNNSNNYFTGYGTSTRPRTSWFSGFSMPQQQHQHYDYSYAAPLQPQPTSSSYGNHTSYSDHEDRSSSRPSTTRTATGYGGTTRR